MKKTFWMASTVAIAAASFALGAETRTSFVETYNAVADTILGDAGAKFLGAAMAVSAFGFLVVTLIATPGVYVAMSREGLFFESFGQLSARTGAPVAGLLCQASVGLGYLFLADAEFLVDSVVFVEWLFHVLIAFGLLWLRRHRADLPRPFRSFASAMKCSTKAGMSSGRSRSAGRRRTITLMR